MLQQKNNQNQSTNKPDREALKTGKSLQGLFPMGSCKYLAPLALAFTALIGTSNPVQAVNIHFDYASGTDVKVREGFEMAANIWEVLLADETDVRIEVAMVDFAGEFGQDYNNVLGLALPEFWDLEFYEFEDALAADATSGDDATAVANLDLSQVENDYDMILTQANAKALGLYDGSSTAYDGKIRINNQFQWDYALDPNTGSTGAEQFHFLSVALHEIAHVLGFTSGLDSNEWMAKNDIELSNTPEAQTTIGQFTALDAFRYDKKGNLNVEEVTNPGHQRFFSLDGTTNIAEFSTGINGDGYQASHWKNDKFWNPKTNSVKVSESLGIMDPAFSMGERGEISGFDLTALDVIGWDLTGNDWNDLNMTGLATQAQQSATISVFQDILEQFAAEQGLAWWWWWMPGGWWAVDEAESLRNAMADNGSGAADNGSGADDISEMLAYAATAESFPPSSLPNAASVPEPGSTAALIGVGLLGLSSLRQRREKNSSD
jgi:hypothetical protein